MKRCLSFIILLLCLAGTAFAEIYVGKDKPADWADRDLMRLTVFMTYSNDAFLLESNGESMLIDGGVRRWTPEMTAALEARGLSHVNYLFNTHPHDDHLECMTELIRTEALSADVFLSLFPETYKNNYQQNMVKQLHQHGILYAQVQEGDVLELGNTKITLFRYLEGADPNALSAVMKLQFGNSTLLLCADLPGIGQRWLMSHYGEEALKADILKVPHHGIVRVVPEFIDCVDPQLSVITNNPEKIPATVGQFRNRERATLYNYNGTITLETDGTDWYVTQTDREF